MTNKQVLREFVLLCVLIAAVALLVYWLTPRPQPAESKIRASPSPAVLASGCDPSLMAFVYHPQRLHVLTPCMTVTGTIRSIRKEPDGDDHIRLELDAEFSDLLNDKNISLQHGDLVIEPICLRIPTQTDAVDACIGANDTVTIPRVGTHVSVTGPYVFDAQHGWNEIHPVNSITVSQGDEVAKIFPPDGHQPAELEYRADVVHQVESALTSFGSIRAWSPAAQFNLLMSVLGSLSYVVDIKTKADTSPASAVTTV